MLLLLCYVETEKFAFDGEDVVEVIPKVKLKDLPHVPEYVAGLLNLGGTPVPVIDICRLIKAYPARNSLHTRIILLKHQFPQGDPLLLGVIAEKVTETADRDKSLFIDSGVNLKDLPFLGGILSENGPPIQLILTDKLFAFMQGVLFKEDYGRSC